MKTIVLTGGGTAGHVMPCLAIVPLLEKVFDKIYYFGRKGGMEEKIVCDYFKNRNKCEFEYVPISATKLIRKLSIKNLKIPFVLSKSVFDIKKILKEIKPNIVFSKGGFVSVPVCIAAKMLKIPVISHECDYTMGLANKLNLKMSKVMCVSFEDTIRCKKCVYTGLPIRSELYNGNKNKVCNYFNKQKPILLIIGGSSGAQTINTNVLNALNKLLEKYNVIHIVGKGKKADIVKENYIQLEFVSDIQNYFAAADLVISRAGANAVFELVALSKPTLLIPLSKKESRGDQIDNAKYFKERNLCLVLPEEKLNPQTLVLNLEKLENKSSVLIENMKKQSKNSAAEKVFEIICKNML